MAIRDQVLGTKAGHALFRKLIRADRSMRTIVETYVRPSGSQVVVDLGCGTGDLAHMLPDSVGYIGVDHNSSYLDPGQLDASTGSRRQFINGDVAALRELELPPIDVAVAIGLLHHLTDEQVTEMLRSVAAKLAPAGRLITVDPVFWPVQASSARLMMALDRGRFVRHPEHYELLVRRAFPLAEMTIRSDLNAFPYTHCIFEANAPAQR
jgi:ubiquinone/menaquinone biosynthesis C-methylase UbiE